MKVYRLLSDISQYQYFLTEDEKDSLQLITDCKPLQGVWAPPSVFIFQPHQKSGDFFNFNSGSLILSPESTDKLRYHLEMAGQLLPITYNSKTYTLLNVTECINCLDIELSEWRTSEKTGIPIEYVFHPKRFSESCIFKIPQTCKTDVLVLDREDGEGFIRELQEQNISGYSLELLWSI